MLPCRLRKEGDCGRHWHLGEDLLPLLSCSKEVVEEVREKAIERMEMQW